MAMERRGGGDGGSSGAVVVRERLSTYVEG